MLIGYAVPGRGGPGRMSERVLQRDIALAGNGSSDSGGDEVDALRALGCEKIFIEGSSAARGERVNFKATIEFLRPGDTLVVTDLRRLGEDIDAVVLIVDRLHTSGIGLRVADPHGRSEIVPGTALGDGFALACRELARLVRQVGDDDTSPVHANASARRRGRPQALSAKDIAKAQRLLAEGTMTVSDVARALGVSPATVYRYFPRRAPRAITTRAAIETP